MTIFNAKLTIVMSAIASLTLAGCGGGAPASGSSTGVFVDSAVEGITYQTATQSGTTNAQGEYQYAAGEAVTFSIGGVTLPSVAAKGVVTPFDMAGTKDVSNPKVLNIGLLLQSLDSDKDPSNGISISVATIEALKGLILSGDDFDTDDVSFKGHFSGIALDDDQDESNDWKTKEEVEDHLSNANGIVGTWMLGSRETIGLVFLKLLTNGQYALLSDQQGTGTDVLQIGTYALNPGGTKITLSKLVGNASTSMVSELAYPIEVSDKLSEFEINMSDGGSKFKRLVSLTDQAKNADKINGVWKFDGLATNKVAVFNKDSTYTVFSLAGSTNGSVVYEQGRYQFTPETTPSTGGTFSFEVIVDTDGNNGFSGANPTAYGVDSTGTTLSLTTTNGLVTLTKILPFDPANLPGL